MFQMRSDILTQHAPQIFSFQSKQISILCPGLNIEFMNVASRTGSQIFVYMNSTASIANIVVKAVLISNLNVVIFIAKCADVD